MAGLREAGAAFGLDIALPERPACEVWPETWRVLQLVDQAQTQWRMGPSGPIGLDYLALPAWCRPGAGGTRRSRQVFEALQVMEAAALEHWRVMREQQT